MKRVLLPVLALAAAASVLVLALRIQPQAGSSEPDLRRADGPEREEGFPLSAAHDATPAARLSAEELHSRLASSSAAYAPADAVRLEGRVVATGRTPVPGAVVELWDSPALPPAIVLAGAPLDGPVVHARCTTDKEGRFGFFVAPRVEFALHAQHPTLGRVLHARAAGEEVLELQLLSTASLHGRVTRARDGRPVPGAEILACIASEPMAVAASGLELADGLLPSMLASDRELESIASTRTAQDGTYELRELFQGPWRIVVRPVEEQPRVELVVLESNDVRQLDLEVLEGRTISGFVHDASTKRPIAGALVRSLDVGGREVRTDTAGAYRLVGVGDSAVLAVAAAGYGGQARLSKDRIMAGQHVVDFELAKEQRARGRVVAMDGRALAGLPVVAVTSDSTLLNDIGRGRARAFTGLRVTTGPAGEFELEGLNGSVHSALVVSAAGFGTVRRTLSGPTVAFVETSTTSRERRVRPGPDLVELGDIVLGPSRSLVVRTRLAGGAPAAGTLVDLTQPAAKQENELLADLVDRRGRTDADGRIEFGDLLPGTFRVEVRFEAGLERPRVAASRWITLDTSQPTSELEILLPKRHLVRGTILDPWGNALAEVQVSADGMFESVASDRSGHFEIELRTSGPTTVRARWAKGEYTVGEQRASLAMATLSGVVPGGHPITLQLLRQLSIRGHVRREGVGVHDLGLQALDSRGEVMAVAFTGKDGAFEIRVTEGEVVALAAYANANAPGTSGVRISGNSKPLSRIEGVAAGRADVVIDVP